MSAVKTYLGIVYDTSNAGIWFFDSIDEYPEVWEVLEQTLRFSPERREQHEVFALAQPLTPAQLQVLEQLKQQQLIQGFYIKDEKRREEDTQ